MSHTGHQNFRVCNPACGCDRVWFPPACVCQRPAVTESVPELSVGVWKRGRDEWNEWVAVGLCVWVSIQVCLGPVET